MGTTTDLSTLGSPNCVACAINDPSRAIGYAQTGGEARPTAFSYPGRALQDLNSLIPQTSASALPRPKNS